MLKKILYANIINLHCINCDYYTWNKLLTLAHFLFGSFSNLFKKWQSGNILFGVRGEPVDVVGGLGVDGGGDVGVAVVSPGDDAAELPVLLADERSARVAVAGGVTIETGAELILG